MSRAPTVAEATSGVDGGRARGRGSAPILAAIVTAFVVGGSPSVAEKTDTLVMQNGDTITGEVKGLDEGQLQYSTDDLGILSVDWDRVATVVSSKTVLIETVEGTRYIGVMEEPSEPRLVALRTEAGVETLEMDSIYLISPLDRGFWRGLKGSFSFGASFTKSSDVLQFSASGDVSKRTRKTVNGLNLNLISTWQSEENNQNITLGYAYLRLLQDRWTLTGMTLYQRNQSVGIENRLLAALGGGRWLIESSRQTLAVMGGLDGNFEDTVGEESGQSSLEAFAALQYSRYRYHHPKQNLSATFTVYPSLTESGRFRAQLNSHWRQEIITSFFFELSVYGTYDNQPPKGALQTTDYGVVTSIGYSFSP